MESTTKDVKMKSNKFLGTCLKENNDTFSGTKRVVSSEVIEFILKVT